jgi:hypothetical protein
LKFPLRKTPIRRGATLAAAVILLPFALFFFLLVMTRIEIANAATKRHERRVQARLLAESAFAEASAQIEAGKFDVLNMPSGIIGASGSYHVEGSPATPGEFKAVGTAFARTVRGTYHVIAEIDFRVSADSDSGPEAIGLRYRIEVPES